MNMKVMVYGAQGWLGSLLATHFQARTPDTNILDIRTVRDEVRAYQPDVVINAAAVCGFPGIDWCEKAFENRLLAMSVNAFGPQVLLESVRQESDALFVHLSTGCLWSVPEDAPPINEETSPVPPNFYAYSKAMGEERLQTGQDVLIVRLRLPISPVPHPRNLIDKLRRYSRVLNVPESVTFTDTLTRAIQHLAELRCTGIYHVVDGALTMAAVMFEYKRHVDPKHDFQVVSEHDPKRASCRLVIDKLLATGFVMYDITETLELTMRAYARNIQSLWPK